MKLLFLKSRERDALAKILEAFVAKEIQPYITTFPLEYYEKLFQSITPNIEYQKFREHLSSTITVMKLSDDYQDFIGKMNKAHPRFEDIIPWDLDEQDK